MAAPSGIKWGSIAGGYGRIGIYTSQSSTNTATTVTVQVWFWSKYSVDDSNNTFYYNNEATSATTNKGSVNISTTVSSGDGWSTSNQKKIASYTHKYNRGTSASSKNCAAKLTNIDRVGATMTCSTSYTIPALASYNVTYNNNGGSGSPSTQKKYYGKTLTLSGTKPTRSGWTFMGWGTSASDTSVNYSPGANYTANATLALYAIWKKTLTLTYNANGGTGAPSKSSADIYNSTSSKAFTISGTKPTKSGFNFLGWSTSSSAKSATYPSGGSVTISANTTLYAVWSLAYVPPTIKTIKVVRTEEIDGTDDLGAKASVSSATVSFSWSTFKDTPTITIECLNSSDKIVSTVTVPVSGTSGTVTEIVGGDLLNVERTYTVRVTVTDSNSMVRTQLIPAVTYPIDFKAGGKGTSIGKAAEFDNTFDVAWLTRIRDHLCVGEKTGYQDGKTGVFISNEGFIHLQRTTAQNFNTYIAFYKDDETSLSAQLLYNVADDSLRLVGANDVYLEARGNKYRPYYSKGDSITIAIATSGYVTNSMKNVTFTIPLSKPAIGVSSVSAAPVNGLTLRQNGAYTHGSSANSGTTEGTYTAASQSGGNYINITVQFSNTDNAVNNAPVGVYWSGTITFA